MIELLAVHQGGGLGGAPVSLLKLLSGLDRRRFRPQVVFTESGPLLEYAAELQIPARYLATGGAFFYSAHARPGVRSLASFVGTFPQAVTTARQYLRRTRPDVLHLNTSVLLAWAVAARRERIPVVWMVREVLGSHPLVRRWHVHFIRRHARRIVAISSSVAACFPSDVPISRVHNAVDLADFRLELLDHRAAVRGELGLSHTDPVLMLLGSVQRPKGHWFALDALARLQSSPLRPKLVLVTGGAGADYARSLRGRVKHTLGLPLDNLDALLRDARRRGLVDTIRVTGFRRDIARVLSAADVVLFASLAPEGFGRPIIEAMAMARPVVATDLGPSRELLGDEAGVLVPTRPDALAESIVELLQAPARRRAMGQAGRQRVEACFSLDRQVAAMSTIYREAARSA